MKFSDDSSGFVSLSEEIPDILLDIRYYSTFNFVGDRIDGYEEPAALLTREAAKALKAVSDEAAEYGFRLKIFDAYRPQKAVNHFVRWASDLPDTRMKRYFYPELSKKEFFSQGYIDVSSAHSRGSTVDLTLTDMLTQKDLDTGGTFDFFGEKSHVDYAGISEEQHEKRMFLRAVMVKNGFCPIETEWWHFTLEKEPWPDTFFDFPVRCAL